MSLLEKFTSYLNANLPIIPSFHPYFNEALNFMLKAGGKHFRAQLLLGVVEIYKPKSIENAMSVALGLEMIHTYSLIHDDLPAMDNADFRRSVPTLHKKYDETTAILVGDGLNTHAFYLISNANLSDNIKIKCVNSLAKSAGIYAMVLGQAIDCYFEKKPLNLDELKFLHLHKTGALIASSLEMGAIICEFDDEKCTQIYNAGLNLGLAFQINDDIIDTTKSAKDCGKPTHNDTNKNSFTNLLGIKKAIEYKNELIAEILRDCAQIEPKFCKMIENLINKYLKDN